MDSQRIAELEQQLLASQAREARVVEHAAQMRAELDRQLADLDEGFLTTEEGGWECTECGMEAPEQEQIDHVDECCSGRIRKVLALPTPEPHALRWLEARDKRAAADEMEKIWSGWIRDHSYGLGEKEVLRYARDRAATFRAEADALDAGEVSRG